jgi:hypothetical protein
MGKHNNSKIHDKYSDWHWNLIYHDDKYKRLYVSDIDRLWLEYDFYRKEIVGVLDIKWEDSIDFSLTPTEKGIYDWFKDKNVDVYIVFIDREFTQFRVVNYLNEERIYDSIGYANFLLSLRNKKKQYCEVF